MLKTDFAAQAGQGLYCLNGQRYGSFMALPGASFSRASVGTATDSAGVVRTFASGVPRITDQGLLVEESRTNLALNSGTLSSYSPSVTVTTDGTLAPDGISNAIKLLSPGGSPAFNYVVSASGSASNNSYSIFVKKGSGSTDANRYVLRNFTTSINLINGSFDFDAGVWTVVVGTAPVVRKMSNGWWRLEFTPSGGISAGDDLSIYAAYVGNPVSAGIYSYAWGAQLEAGAFATSYIPTTGATVTRAADVASIGGLSVSGAMTLFTSGNGVTSSSASYIHARLSDGTNANDMSMEQFSDNAHMVPQAAVGNANQHTLSLAITAGAPFKGAIVFDGGGRYQSAVNGTLATASTGKSALPLMTTLNIGSAVGGTNQPNAFIRRITVYPSSLSDAQLQALTQ